MRVALVPRERPVALPRRKGRPDGDCPPFLAALCAEKWECSLHRLEETRTRLCCALSVAFIGLCGQPMSSAARKRVSLLQQYPPSPECRRAGKARMTRHSRGVARNIRG